LQNLLSHLVHSSMSAIHFFLIAIGPFDGFSHTGKPVKIAGVDFLVNSIQVLNGILLLLQMIDLTKRVQIFKGSPQCF